MYNITNDLSYLDNKIITLKEKKKILLTELTYLTSTERILSLIEKNPKILNDKVMIKSSQLKTKKNLIEISLAKIENKTYNDKKIAKIKNISELIELVN